MDFHASFYKNKQWLSLSFCLVSICLLPTAAQAANAPSKGDQNASITPYPTSFAETYSKARAPLISQAAQEEVKTQEPVNAQAPAVNDRAFRGLDQSELKARQMATPPPSSNAFVQRYDNNPNLDAPRAEWSPEANTYPTSENPREDVDVASYEEEQSPDQAFVGSEWNPTMSDESAMVSMEDDQSWNAPAWQGDSSWGYQGAAQGSCCAQTSCCGGNFKLFGDFLYWNLCQNNLDYALTVTGVNGLDASSQIGPDTFPIWFQGNYKVKTVSSQYKPGFRVGGFYSGGCCGSWDVGVIYTQLNSHYTNHVASKGSGELILSTQIPDLGDAAELFFRSALGSDSPSARSNLHLNYNMADILASTSYSSGSCFTWQPYVGVRFLEIKEKWDVAYAFNPTTSSIPVTSILLTSRWHSKIPAAGLTAGVSGSLSFCGCFSVIGRIGASCVGGRAKEHTRLTGDFTAGSTSGSAAPTSVSKKKCSVLTGFEGSLGLAYTFQCCQTGVQIAAGYEFQNWYNVPTPIEHGVIIPGIKSNPSSNMSLHGLFVRAGVSF